MATKNDLTVEYVRNILDYNPETGIFKWKKRDDVPQKWNTRNSGNITGWNHSNGYLQTCINYKKYYLHRLAWFYVNGVWPDEIDHIDRDKKNNKISNLRVVTHRDNCANRTQRKNPTGYKGVIFSKRDKSWAAKITINGVLKHIGTFKSVEDAATAYNLTKAIYS